jgi:hypothetical protein
MPLSGVAHPVARVTMPRYASDVSSHLTQSKYQLVESFKLKAANMVLNNSIRDLWKVFSSQATAVGGSSFNFAA